MRLRRSYSSLSTEKTVEGLYCKIPIQCLSSSKILTPHPLTARRVCAPRLWCGGRTHSLGDDGVGGSIFRKTKDTALYSIYVSTLWRRPSNNQHMDLCLCITCSLYPCRFSLSLGLIFLPGGQINKGDICLPFPCPFVVGEDS